MDDKGKSGGLAATLTIVGMLALISIVCLAVIGSYLEVLASKRVSLERMQRVTRQIEERKAAEATQRLSGKFWRILGGNSIVERRGLDCRGQAAEHAMDA